MSRHPRPHQPGLPFHLTARVQNSEPLLVGLEHRIIRLVRSSATEDGFRPVAYAVMANHIHIVAVQGRDRLGRYMHRLLHRVAIMVQQHWRRDGHVFHRRYHAVACLDGEQLRSMLAYVHLNPVRADICSTPDRYPWTSHGSYRAGPRAGLPGRFDLGAEDAIRVFAAEPRRRLVDCRDDYRRYLAWRIAADRWTESGDLSRPVAPVRPRTRGGDLHWVRRFARSAVTATGCRTKASLRADLGEIARTVLAECAPAMSIGLLRSGSKSHAVLKVRRNVIARALEAGYAGYQVGRFLRVSSSSISRVAVALRDGAV